MTSVPASTSSFAKGRPWAWFLAATLAATGVDILLPAHSPASVAIYLAVHASVLGAIAWGIRRYRPRPRAAWLAFLVGYAVFLAANAVSEGASAGLLAPLPLPSIVDGLSLATYAALALALVLLLAERGALRDLAGFADALIVVSGLGFLAFDLLIGPVLDDAALSPAARLVLVLYPMADQLVLLALLWLAFTPGPRGPALSLLMGGVVAQTAGDVAFGLSSTGVTWAGVVADPLWLLSLALVGAAALHPSMATLATRAGGRPWIAARWRLSILVLASAAVMVHVLADTYGVRTPYAAAAVVVSVVIFTAVFLRFRWLLVDVDTYARIQAQLTVSETRFRRLVEQVPAVIYVDSTDEATARRYLSPRWKELTGHSPEEAVAHPWLWSNHIHPDDREWVMAAARQANERDGPTTLQYRIIAADSSELWVRDEAMVIERDAEGHPCAWQGVLVDVTAAHRAERTLREQAQALRQSEHNLAEAQRIAHIGSWEWDLVTGAAQRSDELLRIYGVEPGAIPGTTEAFLAFVHPDDRARVQASAQAAITRSAPYSLDYRIVRTDGTVRIAHEQGEVICDERSAPVRMIGTVEDVTERVQAEDEIRRLNAGLEQRVAERTAELATANEHLREANSYLESLVASTPVMLFRGRGPDFAADYISPGVEQILGFTPAEVIARPRFWGEHVHPDDREQVSAGIRDVIEHRLPLHTTEYRMVHRDGRQRWLYAVVHYQFDADGAWRFTGTAIDVTERKRIEDDLRCAKEEAERANRAKSQFLSSMSHELRTPLNAVLGFGQLLERSALSPDDHDSVTQILRGGRTLLAMIDSVLELARVESGRLTLSIEPVSVVELINETVDLLRPAAAGRGIRLAMPADVERPPWVLADRIRLKQVILNLLSNAVTYNRDDGSVTIACHAAAGDRLRLSVTDTGPGIPADRQATLFTILDRRRGAEPGSAGLGVGLALSARLLGAMNGSISVESEVGAGSTFSIELPLAAEPAVEPGERSEPGTGAAAAATVVYVEDNLANLKLVERILDVRPGTRVLAAMQGSLGLDLARQHHPDLVLLDFHLPDIPGEEVLRLLREDPATRDIPVIVLSSALGSGTGRRLLDLGATACFTKPIDVAAFLAAVERVLQGGVAHA